MTFDNMEVLSSGAVHNSVVENPSWYGPVPGGSGPFGNDSNAISFPIQDFFPTGNPSNPFSPTQTGGVGPEGATMTAPNASSTIPPEPRIYAVDVRADSGTEPLCAVFNSQTNYSCMLARVAERLPNVITRNTTPAQRRQWYSTPAGQVYDPQRYAEFYLKAFDPYIPPVKLTMLLLEGDGPIDGVHVYLGRTVFTKLAELQIPLSVREIGFVGQSIGFGAMDWATGQNGNAGMPGKRAVVLQDDMKLTRIKALPGPAPAAYNGGPGPSNMSHFGLTSFTASSELFSSYSDFQDTMSAKTSLFSEPSWCASTISSLDSTVAPSNAMAEFMKNPADDVFVGYGGIESAAHDDDLDSDTIDSAILSSLSQEFVESAV